MPSIPTITNITASTNANTNFTPFPIVSSVFDQTNPNYPRTIQLNNGFLTLTAGTNIAGIALTAILPSLIALVPGLTWPPLVTSGPNNASVVHTAGTSFSITATSEISITYQWALSTNAGASYSNISTAGVANYSNFTTNNLSFTVSNVGMSGYLYKCIATNASGSTNSNAATLTVT